MATAKDDGDLIVFDVDTLTMAEAMAAEEASGMSIQRLLTGTAHQMMLAAFIHLLRNSERPPSWKQLASLRVLDARSSSSALQAVSPSPRSDDSV
jgi:hypothetical protein